jgi:hypothetical protein
MTSFELTVKMNSKEARPGDGIFGTSIAEQKQKARFVFSWHQEGTQSAIWHDTQYVYIASVNGFEFLDNP